MGNTIKTYKNDAESISDSPNVESISDSQEFKDNSKKKIKDI